MTSTLTITFLILFIWAIISISFFSITYEDSNNFSRGSRKVWNELILKLKIIIFKIRNRPKFKKGDLIEWVNPRSRGVNEDIMYGKIHEVKISKEIKWVYYVGNDNGTFGHNIKSEDLRIRLSVRREEGLNELLN